MMILKLYQSILQQKLDEYDGETIDLYQPIPDIIKENGERIQITDEDFIKLHQIILFSGDVMMYSGKIVNQNTPLPNIYTYKDTTYFYDYAYRVIDGVSYFGKTNSYLDNKTFKKFTQPTNVKLESLGNNVFKTMVSTDERLYITISNDIDHRIFLHPESYAKITATYIEDI